MKPWIIIILLSVCSLAQSQTGEVHGTIRDAKTNEVLPYVNVFLNNTTIGTASNENGEFLLTNIPIGTYELVYSYVGYQSVQSKIVILPNSKLNKSVLLIQSETELSELNIVSSRDKVWESKLRRFKKVFLGEGAFAKSCTILNPEVLDFVDKSGLLIATATGAILIKNEALGYRLDFYLKKFLSSETAYSIVGNSRFSELEPKDKDQYNRWLKNRESAYLGSLRHFLKSVSKKNISREGFKVYEEKGKHRSNSFEGDFNKGIITAYDTLNMASISAQSAETKMTLKGKIEVHYVKASSRFNFYQDQSHEVSWIEARQNQIRVDANGVPINPSDITVSGDMFADRISNMLPDNYSGDRQFADVSSLPSEISVRREALHLTTDKPYYYLGERIWFSAFISTPFSKNTEASKVLYVELLDTINSVVATYFAKIDSGRASGCIKIPSSLSAGKYFLRSYTRWMQNYGVETLFYKPIPILSENQRIEPQTAEGTKINNSIKIELDKDKYRLREKVRLKFIHDDDSSRSTKATLAISVVDSYQVSCITDEPTILKLLSKDESFTEQSDPNTGNYKLEKGITLSGTCFRRDKKANKTPLTLIQDKIEAIYQTETDKDGNFSISNLFFYDSMKFAFQFKGDRVKLNPIILPALPSKLGYYTFKILNSKEIYKASQFTRFESDVTLLDEVEIKAAKIDIPKKQDGLYGKPDWYVTSKSLEQVNPNLASAIEMKFLGQFVLTSKGGHFFLVYARGAGLNVKGDEEFLPEPVLFIDNIQFNSSGESVGDRLYSMNTSVIDHIEVSAMTNSQMGANGSSGAIWVFTKKDSNMDNFKSLPILKVRGFDRQQIFFSPNYDNTLSDFSEVDYRATLYWNPKLEVDLSKHVSEVSFFTSDLPGKYRVTIEGLDSEGEPVRIEKFFEVEDK